MLRIGWEKFWRVVPAIACCALFLVAVAGATNPTTTQDPIDTDPGPDVTLVTVSNDGGGVVTVRNWRTALPASERGTTSTCT